MSPTVKREEIKIRLVVHVDNTKSQPRSKCARRADVPFLGSLASWKNGKETGALHLVKEMPCIEGPFGFLGAKKSRSLRRNRGRHGGGSC